MQRPTEFLSALMGGGARRSSGIWGGGSPGPRGSNNFMGGGGQPTPGYPQAPNHPYSQGAPPAPHSYAQQFQPQPAAMPQAQPQANIGGQMTPPSAPFGHTGGTGGYGNAIGTPDVPGGAVSNPWQPSGWQQQYNAASTQQGQTDQGVTQGWQQQYLAAHPAPAPVAPSITPNAAPAPVWGGNTLSPLAGSQPGGLDPRGDRTPNYATGGQFGGNMNQYISDQNAMQAYGGSGYNPNGQSGTIPMPSWMKRSPNGQYAVS